MNILVNINLVTGGLSHFMQAHSKNYSSKNIDNLVSERLKKNRLMLEISSKEIKDIIGVKISQIEKFENSFDLLNNKTHRIKESASLVGYYKNSLQTMLCSLKKNISDILKLS